MKVNAFNQTDFNQYVDVDGDKNTDDTVVVGPKARVSLNIPSEERFIELAKEFKNKLVLRKG